MFTLAVTRARIRRDRIDILSSNNTGLERACIAFSVLQSVQRLVSNQHLSFQVSYDTKYELECQSCTAEAVSSLIRGRISLAPMTYTFNSLEFDLQ